ncbi:hypothetical protein BCV64_04925 [Cylindrospermopsis raciborskii MVCC14]|nr:hypothetical protein BCV64_04925 [Cylindrospermopsis raciborskii MVCC14]
MFNLKAPLFKQGVFILQILPYKKATIPPNVLSYIVFNLKAPLFKQGVFILQILAEKRKNLSLLDIQ